MADVITLARLHAPITQPTQGDTTYPEAIRLHGLASNALATALHLLNQVDTTPAQLERATARAVRAATALKRLSAISSEVTA